MQSHSCVISVPLFKRIRLSFRTKFPFILWLLILLIAIVCVLFGLSEKAHATDFTPTPTPTPIPEDITHSYTFEDMTISFDGMVGYNSPTSNFSDVVDVVSYDYVTRRFFPNYNPIAFYSANYQKAVSMYLRNVSVTDDYIIDNLDGNDRFGLVSYKFEPMTFDYDGERVLAWSWINNTDVWTDTNGREWFLSAVSEDGRAFIGMSTVKQVDDTEIAIPFYLLHDLFLVQAPHFEYLTGYGQASLTLNTYLTLETAFNATDVPTPSPTPTLTPDQIQEDTNTQVNIINVKIDGIIDAILSLPQQIVSFFFGSDDEWQAFIQDDLSFIDDLTAPVETFETILLTIIRWFYPNFAQSSSLPVPSGTIQSSFSDDFTLVLPPLYVKMGTDSYKFFDGYTFHMKNDLTDLIHPYVVGIFTILLIIGVINYFIDYFDRLLSVLSGNTTAAFFFLNKSDDEEGEHIAY